MKLAFPGLFFFFGLIDNAFAIESRIIIAIIDSGIAESEQIKPYLCEFGHRDFTNTTLVDHFGHGTNVAGLILKDLDPEEFCIVVVKFWENHNGMRNDTHLFEALEYVQKVINPKYLNLSLGGVGGNEREQASIQAILNQGTRITVAAGNEGINLDLNGYFQSGCVYYPACYPFQTNFYPIGNLLPNGKKAPTSNYGNIVKHWRNGTEQVGIFGKPMSGTSQASANFMNELIKQENQ